MRHNRRGEPVGRESGVYLYGASRPEVCRKIDPVGVTSAAVRDQASTPLEFGPNLGTPSSQATGDRASASRSSSGDARRVDQSSAKPDHAILDRSRRFYHTTATATRHTNEDKKSTRTLVQAGLGIAAHFFVPKSPIS